MSMGERSAAGVRFADPERARGGVRFITLVPGNGQLRDVPPSPVADAMRERLPLGMKFGERSSVSLAQVEGQEPYIAGMADIVLGIFAILAGGAMLFAGQFVLRLLLPIWGFFAGFAFGAGLFAAMADERFLGTVLGWVTGLVFALIFAVFTYLFYAVAVILAMAAFGFAIGSGLIVALGIDWNWIAVLVGLAFGAVLGLVAVVGNMPMIVLAVVSSLAGAVGVVAGLMLLVGSLNSADFTDGTFIDAVRTSWGWYVLLLVLAVVGIVAQTRQRVTMRRTVRETWYAESSSLT